MKIFNQVNKNAARVSDCCLTHCTRKTTQMISDENNRQQNLNIFTNISAEFCNQCGRDCQTTTIFEQITEQLSNIFLDEKIPIDIYCSNSGELLIPANRRITKTLIRKVAANYQFADCDPSPIRNKLREYISRVCIKFNVEF